MNRIDPSDTRIDPTLTIERLARRLRDRCAPHPVSGAVAQAARGAARMTQEDFALLLGVAPALIHESEAGVVAFGDLLPQLGLAAESCGADLLSLADLEAHWRRTLDAAAGH